MKQLITRLQQIEKRGYCWNIGRSRLSKYECRIYPMEQDKRKPVIIVGANSFEQAVEQALERLGDAVPR